MKEEEKDYCADCTVRGKCCQFGYIIDGKKYWVEPAIKCHWLTDEGTCAVYYNREVLAPWCKTVEDYASEDGAPKECGYREIYDFKYDDGGMYEAIEGEKEILTKTLNSIGQKTKAE